MSIRAQAKLLKIPRGLHYYKPRGMNEFNLYLTKLIDEQYQRTPFYGVPRMTDYLNGLCLRQINHKRVERLYNVMDIKALGPNPNTSKSDPRTFKYPYLLRNLTVTYPNQVWVADITYTALHSGYMYLFAIMDLYSRLIVAWDISNSMTAAWCKYVLVEGLQFFPTPEILNTDQGIQFTSDLWIKGLVNNGIKISMDGKGRAIDNIFIERFWRSYKYEYLYLNPPNGGKELFEGTKEYMDYYNHQRPHSSLEKLTPAEKYHGTKTHFVTTKYSQSLV
jgi:putative transposase